MHHAPSLSRKHPIRTIPDPVNRRRQQPIHLASSTLGKRIVRGRTDEDRLYFLLGAREHSERK